ncbi:MAG: ribosome biogenesis factor YjgA [Deferrisomatales bacterium]|nr:ribosome biogenesis factor YjgA [Deferrisomatales bacterium]
MRQPDADHTPSRSDRKRADKPVQDLARQLAELPLSAYQALPAPEDLKVEILSAIRTTAHGARNRQIKRLASLLRRREQDAEVLRDALSGQAAIHRDQVQAHKGLETLRDRLCDPDQTETAVEEAVRRFPGVDRMNLLRLSRAAHAAKGTNDRRAYREIFRCLHRAREDAGEPGGEAAEE